MSAEVMPGPHPLSDQTHAWLLSWARRSIGAWLAGSHATDPGDVPPEAREPGGCFVTLHSSSGDLRGCIGTFVSTEPLWRQVREMAEAAATRDPRFTPVQAAELDACEIEISALTPPRSASPGEVEVGNHGVCVRRGIFRGVLLPQVATEQGWDREAFLDHTCIKAGLPAAAWRDGSVEIEVFSADVFSE